MDNQTFTRPFPDVVGLFKRDLITGKLFHGGQDCGVFPLEHPLSGLTLGLSEPVLTCDMRKTVMFPQE